MTLLRGLNPSVLQAPYRDSGDKSAFSQVSLEDVWGALRTCGTDIRSRWSVSQTEFPGTERLCTLTRGCEG